MQRHTALRAIADEQRQTGPGKEGGEGPVASLKAVDFGYEPSTPVVRAVTAQLHAGRLCALIGPNASGKSTLLKLMLGQLDPWEGAVSLAGRPVAGLSYRRRAALASYVPQKGSVSFAFTVREMVKMGRYAVGEDDGAVDEALGMCDLVGLEGRVYAQLSGGQQQRVLLARALAQSRDAGRVMLLDEPASGMDLWHVHQTMRLLRGLAHGQTGAAATSSVRGAAVGAGLGVLVVLHDVNLAARYADDVWLMDGGRLAAAGSWDRVLTPKLLEPVYRVGFKPMQPPDDSPDRTSGTDRSRRPVFWIDPGDRIS